MWSLHLEVGDVHAVLTKVMAAARMNEVRIARFAYEAASDLTDAGRVELVFGAGDPDRVARVVARAHEIVGVTHVSAERVAPDIEIVSAFV